MNFKVNKITLVDRDKWIPKPNTSFGEMWKWHDFWILTCPRCGVGMRLQHDVKVEGGKVTISPSVGCTLCRAHFFVNKGKIRR